MTIHFDKGRQRWRYDFQRAGKRYQGYCLDTSCKPVTSERAARHAEALERQRVTVAPKLPRASLITLADVVAELAPGWQRGREWENKRRYAREILKFFGASTLIAQIGEAECLRYVEFAASRPIMVWKGGARARDDEDAARYWHATGKTRAPATANRHFALLRLILAHAGKLRDPVTGERVLPEVPSFTDLPEPKRKARPVPEPVLHQLVDILPQHAVDALILTLSFGFRRGEAFGLVESQIDWEAEGVRLFADQVKNAEDVFLPGAQFAMGYLRALAMESEARDVKSRHLITYRHPHKTTGEWRPILAARTSWRTAMKKVEEATGRKWRWHDLRAAFITQVALAAGPMAAQAMARHSDFGTTRAYIEVADEVTRRAADRVAERPILRLVAGQKSLTKIPHGA